MKVLGIDQSYTQLGIALIEGKTMAKAKLISVKWYKYKGCRNKTEKRRFVAKLIKHAMEKYEPDLIIVERIRTFSQKFISPTYMKATGALIATIVDNAYPKKVFSADTRSWKSQVCGSSKGKHKADKGVSVRFINERFGMVLNDDAADAICIALYGLSSSKIIKEEN